MKYKDLKSEDARKICKKYAYRKGNQTLTNCEKCPLRRTRTLPDGTERTLFCFYRLEDLIKELTEEYEEFKNEEIKYYKELEQ